MSYVKPKGNDFSKDVTALITQFNGLVEEYNSLDYDYLSKQSKLESLDNDIADLETTIQLLKSEINNLETRKQVFFEELDSQTKIANQALKARENELESKINDLHVREVRIKTDQADLEAKYTEYENRTQDISKRESQLKDQEEEFLKKEASLNNRVEALNQYSAQLKDQEEELNMGKKKLSELIADSKKDKAFLLEKIKSAEILMQEADNKLSVASNIEQKNRNELKIIEGRHNDLKKIEQGLRKKEVILQEKQDTLISQRIST